MNTATRRVLSIVSIGAMLATGAVGVAAAPAAAAAAPRPSGHARVHVGLMPAPGHRSTHGEPPPDAAFQVGLMTSHSGPVMHDPTAYTLFWEPPGSSVSPRYNALINQYFQDVGGSSWYQTINQYTDTSGAPGTGLKFGGSWVDASPFPNGEGSQANPLTDADIDATIQRALAANAGWHEGDLSHEIFVYLPRDVFMKASDGSMSFDSFCAFHSTTDLGSQAHQAIYSLMPYGATQINGQPACLDTTHGEATPNNDDADVTINGTAHELAESVSDPIGDGWYFQDGNHEIGDQCDPAFGTPDAHGVNVVLNNHGYSIQALWSNQAADPANPGMSNGCVLSAAAGSPGAGLATPEVAGSDRIDTSISTSQTAFPDDAGQPGSPAFVVLARSEDYPDALSGASLLDKALPTLGDLLINPADHLDPRVSNEIQRVLKPGGTVYLLGGELALSAAVAQSLQALHFTVTRVAGPNRFGTAAAVANLAYSGLNGGGKADASIPILLATGLNFPDAIAAGAAAAARAGVVLLTLGAQLPPETAAVMQAHPTSPVYAIGGPAVTAAPSATPVAGTDRYDTAAKAAALLTPKATLVALATGQNFPDALSGANLVTPFQGGSGALLLTPNDVLAPPAVSYLQADDALIEGWIVGAVIQRPVADRFGTFVH